MVVGGWRRSEKYIRRERDERGLGEGKMRDGESKARHRQKETQREKAREICGKEKGVRGGEEKEWLGDGESKERHREKET